ncbi:putative rhamnosyl transferase [Roseobacteraceae bacterium S113]
MQILGFCRFSYPAEGGFQVEHETLEARRAYLYAPARMEERFRHFEAITLPSIAAQTDEDFTFLILIGEDLPEVYFTRLMDLVRPVRQIRVVALPPLPHRKACQQVINAARDDDSVCLQFRHDDDDAVALTYVETLRAAFDDVHPLLNTQRYIGIDHNRGFVARPDAQGICAEEQVTQYWGVAMAMAVRPGVGQTIMNFAHKRLPLMMPTVTFTDTPMYVRGHNEHNDSRQAAHVKPIELPRLDALGEELFRETFGIDVDHVRKVFAGAP